MSKDPLFNEGDRLAAVPETEGLTEPSPFMKVIARMPTDWTCCKCGQTFPSYYPGGGGCTPEGFKIGERVDQRTGHVTRFVEGDLCKGCMAPRPLVEVDYSKLEARVVASMSQTDLEVWDANAPEGVRQRGRLKYRGTVTGRFKP